MAAAVPFTFSFIPTTTTATATKRAVHFRPRAAQATAAAALTDPFVINLADALEDSLPAAAPPPFLDNLRLSASSSALSKPWPSRKDEPFRFTDLSFLKTPHLLPVTPAAGDGRERRSTAGRFGFSDGEAPTLAIVDGRVEAELSDLAGLPAGVFVGSISDAPEPVGRMVGDCIAGLSDGDLFWDLNGIGAPDVAVVYVPAGVRVVERPLRLVFASVEGGEEGSGRLPVSSPRCIVVVEKGGEIGIVEEFFGGEDKGSCYWANSVVEVVVEEGATVRHAYWQRQSSNAAHIKWTFVRQGMASKYELVEISTGGKLSRHNLHIQQLGPDTETDLSTLHLCGVKQTQDLHSRLVLDHPRGKCSQLHKCIVSTSSGKGVFDGLFEVNRFAQQTDAGQLSRNLLLAPKATVNLKPNLKIIADDVKCTHGATVSDLEEDQLFYIQTRGIDVQAARKALVFSFAKEIIERLPGKTLRSRVENYLQGALLAEDES